MRKIKILVDSCADLSGELLEQYDIDYARMNTVHNGQQTQASLTWEYYSPKELYDTIRGGERITTTQVPVEEFMRIFKKYLDEDCDIIYIACSSKQSGSVNTGAVVAKELMTEYSNARIEAIDSLNACIGQGILGIYAADLVREGKDFDTVVQRVTEARNHVNQYVTVNTLEYLHRAGRVKGAKAFFGNLMGVKPILISDADGTQVPVKKSKGRMGSFTEIVNMLAATIENAEQQTVYLAHADCTAEEVETLKKLLKDKINCKDIITVYIGPIIGASIGPDAIGIWAFGKEVTYRVGEAK